MKMKSLTQIANECGTDKGSLYHGYTIVYDMLMAPMRHAPISLLEIGLLAGGPEVGNSVDRKVEDIPSMRMWLSYFQKASLYGLDICDFSAFENERFKFFLADCGNRDELGRVAQTGIQFDIIIDDGSHASLHQQLALETLLPTLKPGGLFIIEDMAWQPAEIEERHPMPKTTDLLFNFLRDRKSCSLPSHITSQINSVVLFSEDDLVKLRKNFNDAAGVAPKLKHYADGSRSSLRSRMRRIAEAVQSTIDAFAGASRLPPRTTLAIIQKAWA